MVTRTGSAWTPSAPGAVRGAERWGSRRGGGAGRNVGEASPQGLAVLPHGPHPLIATRPPLTVVPESAALASKLKNQAVRRGDRLGVFALFPTHSAQEFSSLRSRAHESARGLPGLVRGTGRRTVPFPLHPAFPQPRGPLIGNQITARGSPSSSPGPTFSLEPRPRYPQPWPSLFWPFLLLLWPHRPVLPLSVHLSFRPLFQIPNFPLNAPLVGPDPIRPA